MDPGNMDLKKQEDDQKEWMERIKLLEIFPEELWDEVFKACGGDAETLTACSKATIFWRELLETRRSEYLFPQVLKILAEQRYITRDDSADLLQLRLVCKNWRLGVNALLETPPHHQESLKIENYRHLRTQEIAHPTYLRLYLSDPPETWNKFESELLPQLDSPLYKDGSSPFPSRTIEIFGSRPRPHNGFEPGINPWDITVRPYQWERNLTLVEHLLAKVGRHIWSLTVCLGGGDHQFYPRHWYAFLNKFQSLLPNLKSLYLINGPFFGNHGLGGIGLNGEPPFPKIKSLELVSMENVPRFVMKEISAGITNLRVCIVPEFLGAHDHCRAIRDWRDDFNDVEDSAPRPPPKDPFDFSCLHDPHTICASIPQADYFYNLPEQWNLKVLRVDLSRFSTLYLPAIFMKLESYKDSLDEVQISVADAACEDDRFFFWQTSKSPLDLPRLKRLEMEVRNICSLDFLLGLTSLEYLVFEANHNETRPPSKGSSWQQINFQNGYENRSEFMKCNIWNKIPSLKRAAIKFAHGTTLQLYRRGNTS